MSDTKKDLPSVYDDVGGHLSPDHPDDMMPNSSDEFENYKAAGYDYYLHDNVYLGVARTEGAMNDFIPSMLDSLDMDGRFIDTSYKNSEPEISTNGANLDLLTVMNMDYSINPVLVPHQPIVVLSTSFKCCRSANDIINSISETFDCLGVSYEFTPGNSEFNAVFVKGKLRGTYWVRSNS